MARVQPASVVSDRFVAVADRQLDVAKAVVGERRLEIGLCSQVDGNS